MGATPDRTDNTREIPNREKHGRGLDHERARRLGRRLLVHAQHQRAGGRIQVEINNIVALAAMRLE